MEQAGNGVETVDQEDKAPREGRTLRDVDRMGGFAKGLSVIEAFGKGRNRLTIAEVARLSGLDRASARRCLLTLVEAGYAGTDDRYFQLTPRILRLGHSYLSASLPRLIQPSLDQLSDRLRDSCSAAVLDGKDVIYIARSSAHRIMGAGLHAGSRLPAYCSTMGRVMLAALPSEQARDILESADRKQLTERTLTDVGALMDELARVREQGYAYIDQELEIGSRSVAVPIRNLSGRTVGAINAGLHVSRGSPERVREEILPALFDVQAQLAEILP